MDANKLTINIKKTQYMIVSGHHKKYENVYLHIKDSQIIRTKSYKYLGVKVDQHLNYSQDNKQSGRNCEKQVKNYYEIEPLPAKRSNYNAL